MNPNFSTSAVALSIVIALCACGGTQASINGGGPDAGPDISVTASPKTALVQTGLTATFTATVVNSNDSAVSWTVAEGAAGGTVSSSGVYTAPATAGTYHVVASAHADETKKDGATVTVAAPGVTLVPTTALVVTGTTKTFAASVIGIGGAVTWTMQDTNGGSIDANGKYTPPSTPGTYHFVATSVNDSSKTAIGVATVVSPGSWINVTPPGVRLNGDYVFSGGQDFNYGAQEVVADLNNPGTFLVQVTYQGVWRSQDYGATWTRLGDGNGPMDNGRAALSIAPDGSYILATLLYPLNGFSNGAWKSLSPNNGGGTADLGAQSNWRRISIPGVPDDDMGVFHIDPADKTHVIGQPHTVTGSFYESNDSGETWVAHAMPPNSGSNNNCGACIAKLNLINSTTLVATYDFGASANSVNINPQLGKKSGSNWSWSVVSAKNEAGASTSGQQTFHGSQQVFVDTVNSAIYLGGSEGVHRSADGGATWTRLATPQNYSESIVATPNNIYSASAFAGTDGFQNDFQHAPRASADHGSAWVSGTTPASMTNGWLGAAVAQDTNSSKWVIVAGCWDAGIFIYVEP